MKIVNRIILVIMFIVTIKYDPISAIYVGIWIYLLGFIALAFIGFIASILTGTPIKLPWQQ